MRPGQNGYVCGHCSALFLVNTCLDDNLLGARKRKREDECSNSTAELSRNHKIPRQENLLSIDTLEPNQEAKDSESDKETVDSLQITETGVDDCDRSETASSVTLSAISDENQESLLLAVPKDSAPEENNLGEGCYSRVSNTISHNCESQEEIPGNQGTSNCDASSSPDYSQTFDSPGCISDPYYSSVLIDPTVMPVSKCDISTQTSWYPESDVVTDSCSTTTLTQVSQSTVSEQSSNSLFNGNESVDFSHTNEPQIGCSEVRDSSVTPTISSEDFLNESNTCVLERGLLPPTSHTSSRPNVISHTAAGTQNNIPAVMSRNEIYTGSCHVTTSPSLLQVSAANSCHVTPYGSKIATDVEQVSGKCKSSYRFPAENCVTQESTDSCVTTGDAPITLQNAWLQRNWDDTFTGKHSTQSKKFNKSNTGSSINNPASNSSNCRPNNFNLSSFEPKKKSSDTEDDDLLSAKDLEKFLTEFRLKRTELQLSQTAVCRTLNHLYGSGFEQSTLSRFESGQLKYKTMVQKKRQIAEALKVLENKHDENDMDETSLRAKKRRCRAVFDFKVKESLERYYSQNHKPSSSELASIGEKLHLQKDVVRVWFCNRRAKEKLEPSKPVNLA